MDSQAYGQIPITVVTGFLGSGKTTLLSRLLRHPELRETAVIVNEFGDIGLDHHLVEAVSDQLVLLNRGCLCCSLRQDLVSTLRDLYVRRENREIPHFRRVAVETSGLADPTPILRSIVADPLISTFYALDRVVTTVDAVNGAHTLHAHGEAAHQAAVADRLILTKTDLAEPEAKLFRALSVLNPGAPLICARQGDIAPGEIVSDDTAGPVSREDDFVDWVHRAIEMHGKPEEHQADHQHYAVTGSIESRAFVETRPLDWRRFLEWIRNYLERRGIDLLRVKGLVHTAQSSRPIVIHGVQHVFHEPTTFPKWPGGVAQTQLVFIGIALDWDEIAASLADCVDPSASEDSDSDAKTAERLSG
ncbi:MAG: GTP-binding protein [Alphaproteobacteria bacterium]|nr:GTP-binding protein [Alphaproteobacteria bacterium]